MTFSGIAAIQAQINAIEQQVGAVASPGTGRDVRVEHERRRLRVAAHATR